MDEFLGWTLFVGASEAVLALGFLLILRARNHRITGRAQFTERGPRRGLHLLSIPLALLLVLVFVTGAPRPELFLALLLASAGVLWFQPHPLDQVYGEFGLQKGWRARRFEALEEWRLTGDHLRFRLDGTWIAVAVPNEVHSEVRELLKAKCPERESRFSR